MRDAIRNSNAWMKSLAVGLCGLWIGAACAQGYPVKPVRLVAGFAAGGSTDLSARLLAQRLTEYLGQQVIVENRTGAGTAIANALVAKSPADGYTLLVLPASAAGLSAVRKDLPYDLERDFTPISRVATTTYVLMVHPSLPVKNAQDLIALARKHPGQLSHGSEGFGASGHLCAALFKTMARIDILHVPYKGGSESSIATASGQVAMAFPSLTAALPMYDAGRVKLLAVTSAKRSILKPDISTLAESGLPGYDRSVWNGVAGPANLPQEITMRLHSAIAKALASAEMKDGLRKLGLEPVGSTPEEFAAFIRTELAQNIKLMQGVEVGRN